MNPLFNQLNKPINDGGMSNFIREVRNFRKSFTGNPKDEVQRLLNSGQLSQADFNRYSQIAQQVVQAMGENSNF